MVRIKVKLGSKGQVVIPKIIRDSVGLVENEPAIMEVKGGVVEIRPIKDIDVIKKWEEKARKDKVNVSKWIYGDKLYKSEFQ
jgi:AbrB family looped-hinge helix DNA binding protein